MKNIIYIILISLIGFLTACKKGEVPGNNQKYVGVWKNEKDKSTTDTYVLTIHEDGKAEYNESTTNGAKYSNLSVTGYIYFDGPNFKIGSNRINKKFKTNVSPTRVTTSVKPTYTYYYIATFNNVNYKKEQ